MDKNIEAKIKKEMKPISLIMTKSKKLVLIKSNEDIAKANEFLIEVKNKIDSLETERKSYTAPINETIKKLNAKFKELTAPLVIAEKAVKDAILSYREECEKARLETQSKIQKKNGDKDIIIASVMPTVIESESGKMVISKKWTFEIIDEKKVPKEFLMVDRDKVDEAIDKGVRVIEGLHIYEKETVNIRR
jgi:hypothetical protein